MSIIGRLRHILLAVRAIYVAVHPSLFRSSVSFVAIWLDIYLLCECVYNYLSMQVRLNYTTDYRADWCD